MAVRSAEEEKLYLKIRELVGDKTHIVRNYRPEWLKNHHTNNNLEIDIYFPQFCIGIEYQGMVHFKHIKKFNNDVDKIREHDNYKNKKVKSVNHRIIEIFPQELNGNLAEIIKERVLFEKKKSEQKLKWKINLFINLIESPAKPKKKYNLVKDSCRYLIHYKGVMGEFRYFDSNEHSVKHRYYEGYKIQSII